MTAAAGALLAPAGADLAQAAELGGPTVGELVRRWLLGKRSVHTRAAYGRDLAL